MKGYELYSWKFRGEWYFSLLVGTNRLKSRKEVTSLKVRVKGVEALKLRLNRLSRGEEVSWSEGLIPRMVLPSDNIIKEVETYCNQQGLILRVSERGASPASNNPSEGDVASSSLNPLVFCARWCAAKISNGDPFFRKPSSPSLLRLQCHDEFLRSQPPERNSIFSDALYAERLHTRFPDAPGHNI
jgi:hypothetical protein